MKRGTLVPLLSDTRSRPRELPEAKSNFILSCVKFVFFFTRCLFTVSVGNCSLRSWFFLFVFLECSDASRLSFDGVQTG